MHAGNITALDGEGSRSDQSFQNLLLGLPAAAQGLNTRSLVRLFCQRTRKFFRASGAYYWELVSPDELQGAEADGLMADRFPGTRLKLEASASAVAAEAIGSRKTVYRNGLDPTRPPLGAEHGTRSIMGAPLMVAGEVIGAIVFVHHADPLFFSDDMATKATILAAQLGNLLEAIRLQEASGDEHRRTKLLAEVAQALHAVPDPSALMETLADGIRVLVRTSLVAVLVSDEDHFSVRAVSGETPRVASAARAYLENGGLAFATEISTQAISRGELYATNLDVSAQGIKELTCSGLLLAIPFRTSRAPGVILVFPRKDGIFSSDERSLLSTITGFGAVAVANAELHWIASAQAQELHQLLEISSDLGSVGNLDPFMRKFVERAASFLRFRWSFLGVLENGAFQLRWASSDGKVQLIETSFPTGAATRALLDKEAFWTNHASEVLDTASSLGSAIPFQAKQLLTVPLVGSDGQVLGMFGVLDHKDGTPVSEEDARRAKALAAEAAVALELTRKLDLSDQNRRHGEALMSLSLETGSLLKVPDFAKSLVSRAASLLNANAAALALYQNSQLETVVLERTPVGEIARVRELNRALEKALESGIETRISGKAADILSSSLASCLGWDDLILSRLHGSGGELVGVLCLANRGAPLSREDDELLQAIVGHASIALENARLFTRMDQANRHWVEIFDAISDFIVVHDEQHNVLRVNRPLADFIGVAPKELIGVSMGALVALATDTTPTACPFCRSGVDGADEFVQPVLEGTYLVSTSRIHASQSERLQTIHVLKDITDRREAERRYRELFDNIQEGLFFTSPDGRFVEVNDALVRMLGFESRQELLQADFPAQIYISADRRREVMRLMEEQGVLRNYHEALRRKDGSIIHVLMNAFAVRDGQGRITQFRGLMLDITDLKNFQAELQRERDFSSKILNNTQSLILVADTAGLISYANRRWTEAGGYQQQQLVGRPLSDLIAPSRREAILDALHATLSGQQVDNLELPVMRVDGRTGQFSINLSPMRDEQGHVSSIVVVMTDITDAAMLQAKLVHTEKLAAVGQLVSGVAHEVNNPLTAILGFADLLLENPEINDTAKKDLRVILQEAQRTKQIVQNLLSFARQMPPQRRPVQLNSILSRTIQLRAYDFSSHGIEVAEHFHSDLPEVIGDSHQLQQVFLNIINNAYDAVRETGRPARIEIMTSITGGFAEVTFRDNGHGISHADRIFDPFFTTKEVGKGTGLGLSICYGIVREHGGEIFCHNNEDGLGATFIVRLPAISEAISRGAVQRSTAAL